MCMRKIDFNNWERKELFKHFSSYSNPYYSISFNLDITELKKFSDENNFSFYKTMIYCVSEAVNKTDAFLYLCRNNEIYKTERREPSYTYLPKDSDNFRFIYAGTGKGFKNFIIEATAAENNENTFIDEGKESDELIHISSLPWLDITSVTNARNITGQMESIPKFTWGKYIKNNDSYTINMSLEVNHAFIDGIHIKEFVDNFYKTVKKLGE